MLSSSSSGRGEDASFSFVYVSHGQSKDLQSRSRRVTAALNLQFHHAAASSSLFKFLIVPCRIFLTSCVSDSMAGRASVLHTFQPLN